MKKSIISFIAALFVGVTFAQETIPLPVIPEAEAPAVEVAPQPAVAEAASLVTPPAAEAASAAGMSFGQAWQYGGWIMWILLIISVFALAIVIYLIYTLREKVASPRYVVTSVRDNLLNGDFDGARKICERNPSAIASVALSAIDYVRTSNGKPKEELIRDAVQSEGVRLTESMQSQAQILLDLAAIAPMIGLLGTTLGMLQAFGSIAQDVMVAAKPIILAQGVSKAIITTIAGLMVAIPCMFAYAFFRRRVAQISTSLEKAATEITNAVIAGKDVK